MQRYTQATITKVRALHKKGLPFKAIAKVTGMKFHSVVYYLKVKPRHETKKQEAVWDKKEFNDVTHSLKLFNSALLAFIHTIKEENRKGSRIKNTHTSHA